MEQVMKRLGAFGAGLVACGALAGCGDDAIQGVGAAEIAALPADVIFGQIQLGEEESQTFLLQNNGTTTLRINDFSMSGQTNDFEVEDFRGWEVGPGEVRPVMVMYRPSDDIPDTATITISSNARQSPTYRVNLLTQDQVAFLASDPGSLLLTAPAPEVEVLGQVTLYNFGSRPLDITELQLVANTGEWQVRHEPSSLPVTLQPEEEYVVPIAFRPRGGGFSSDRLWVSCNAANCENGRFFVNLDGQTDAPRLRVTPGDVTFGAVAIEPAEPPTRTVTATNDGTGLLLINSLAWAPNPLDGDDEFRIETVDGEAWDPARTEPWELSEGESMEIVLSYFPVDALPDVETLVFRSNDVSLPIQTVRVGGVPALPRIEVFPTTVEFPLTALGLTTTRTVTIRNAGSEPLSLAPLRTQGGGFNDNAFRLVNGAAMPDTLGADEEFRLEISFTPPLPDIGYAGTLYVLPTNDPLTEEVRVDITGNSAREPECQLRPLPPTINFGTVARGSRTERTGRVRNSGSGPCDITSVTKQASGGLFGRDYFELVSVDRRPPFTLDPGDEFQVTVSYFPTATTDLSEVFGDTGSVAIVARDPFDTSRRVTCGAAPSGFGVTARDCGINLQARSAVADVAVIPGNVDFGLTTLGCNSQTETVRVYNTGGADVDVTSIALEGCDTEFAIAGVPTLPRTLRRGEQVSFQVRYRPANEGRDACAAIVSTSAPGGDRIAVPLVGTGVTFSRTIDRFEQLTGRKVDMLFVVDNSGSMSDVQNNLARNFTALANAATTWGSDFQIGVVTTQTEGSIPSPGGGNRKPGELVGTTRIVTPSTPGFASVIQNNLRVGAQNSSESASERGLESARLALSDPLITDIGAPCSNDAECGGTYQCIEGANNSPRRCGGFNRTFLRDDASIEVIFVSDEEDQSRAELSFYVDFLKSIKGFRNTSLMHASALVGPPPSGCGNGPRDVGSADAGRRYWDVARETGGVQASICDPNFSTALEAIGNRAFGLRLEFFLSRPADPSTVRVFTIPCGGGARTERTSGWSFDVDSNSVIFQEATAPQPGNCFEVEYEAACF